MNKYLVLVGLSVLMLLASASTAFAQVADYVQLGNVQTQNITAHGSCARITNNTGLSLFIPTKTEAEWLSFKNNPPANVAVINSCGCAASGGCSAAAEGGTCTTYSSSAATSPTTCSSLATVSTCTNGSWSTAPQSYGSCTQNYRSCAASGGCSATAHGGTCTTYSSSVPNGATCSSVSRTSTCNDGTWNLTPYSYGSCSNGCTASGACSASSHGATCTSYSSNSVAYPSSCPSAVSSTCSNGSWSPAPASYSSCSVTYIYSWQTGSYGSCSSSCGTGTQTRSVWCQRNDGATVSDSYCSSAGAKPGASTSCSDYSGCPYYWNYTSWGSCSTSCGGGTQSRTVWCERGDGTTVSDSYCGGGKPSTSQSCNTCSCSYGNSCTVYSAYNSCGQRNSNTGTIQCNGSCSASTPSVPANPANYGNSCTSSANACGQTSSGTIQCNGSCSATTPSNPAYYGTSCTLTSSANSCGTSQTCSGTRDCNNNCTGSCPAPAIPGVQSCSACNGAGCNYGTTNSCGTGCNALLPYYCWSSPGGCIYGSTAGSPAGQNICQASDPSYYGQSCSLGTSAANACGQTQSCSGTYNCAQQCSGTCNPPADSCSFSWYPESCPYNPVNTGSCGNSGYPNYYQYYYWTRYFNFVCRRSTDNATVSNSYCGGTPPTGICNMTCGQYPQ